MVRVGRDRLADSLVCTILNDLSVHLIRRDTEPHFLADLAALEAAVAVFSGAPTIVSGASELC